jgi:hypothetical protein
MKTKNIIWGLVLVLIGTLFILKNLDIVYFSWHSIWRLWPVVLVLIGIAILPIKSGIKIALTIVTLIIATIILVSFPKYHDWNSWSDNLDRSIESPSETPMIDQKIFEPFDAGISEAELVFDAAAGNFKIEQTTTELFEFLREGNLGKYNYSMKELGSRRDIRIELDEGRVRNIDLKNKVSLKLNPAPLWDLKIDVGAASIDMDLSEFRINNLDIDGGASSINIKMGNKQEDGKVKINSGASSITIKVPQDVACEVRVKTVLSSKNLNGFDRVSDGTYVTPGFAESSKNLVIQIEAAVSSLQVERY